MTRRKARNSRLAVQADLHRCRNQDHSPIYTFPPELLTPIFLFTCTSEEASWEKFGPPTRQVVVLSSVSSYWRQVVLEIPSLWNTVTLVVKGRTTSETKAALLQHHLTHAINLGVSLDVSPDLLLGGRSRMVHAKPVADVLFVPENAQKVTSLRVKNTPAEWLTMVSQLPRLHTLVLENLENHDHTPLPPVDLHTQPLLKIFLSFDDSSYGWRSTNLPSSVQEFVTDGSPCNILFESLRQCPNLTRAIHVNACKDRPPTYFTTPLTLGRLETLTWPAWSLDLTSVQNLSLPTLKHLCLELDGSNSREPIITFCHQLSETLTSLELKCFGGRWEVGDFRGLFLRKLERLEILELTDWPLSQLVMATRVLTPSAEEFSHNELPTLPSLQSLVLKAELDHDFRDSSGLAAVLPRCSKNSTRADDMVFLFLDFLKKRRAGEITPFRLDLPVLLSRKQKLKWSDRQRDKLRHVIEGRCVEVLQGGEEVFQRL